jgi:hypothetical protein
MTRSARSDYNRASRVRAVREFAGRFPLSSPPPNIIRPRQKSSSRHLADAETSSRGLARADPRRASAMSGRRRGSDPRRQKPEADSGLFLSRSAAVPWSNHRASGNRDGACFSESPYSAQLWRSGRGSRRRVTRGALGCRMSVISARKYWIYDIPDQAGAGLRDTYGPAGGHPKR